MVEMFAETSGIQLGAASTLTESAINQAGSMAASPLTTLLVPGTSSPMSIAGSAAASAHGVLYEAMSSAGNTFINLWSEALQNAGFGLDMTETSNAVKLV